MADFDLGNELFSSEFSALAYAVQPEARNGQLRTCMGWRYSFMVIFQPASVLSPADKRRQRRRFFLLLAGLVVAFAVLWFVNHNEPVKADAGDCLKGTTADEMEIVDCTSPDAVYTVLGRVEDRSETDAESIESVCSQWPEATHDYWRSQKDSKGIVICLKQR
ncbi:hypothetical protein ABZS66_52930 [Dactylosporangium sp. NPDC005572]|uniref:LppU/SCO3897 family protein n=1 Tax=Dactylosporangium sp. NPDC005572 TaxID=3156889 RepID=UPI0033A67107